MMKKGSVNMTHPLVMLLVGGVAGYIIAKKF